MAVRKTKKGLFITGRDIEAYEEGLALQKLRDEGKARAIAREKAARIRIGSWVLEWLQEGDNRIAAELFRDVATFPPIMMITEEDIDAVKSPSGKDVDDLRIEVLTALRTRRNEQIAKALMLNNPLEVTITDYDFDTVYRF